MHDELATLETVNLVGHVAVATRRDGDASPGLLAGSMLPDLGSIARVRLMPASAGAAPEGDAVRDLADGIALHHASDTAFHDLPWFHRHSRLLRDLLLEAGVDRGPARACAHAGLEMLLDGVLVTDPVVERSTDAAFGALTTNGPIRDAAAAAVAPDDRVRWVERLDQIGRSLDPRAYASAPGIATRLHRMTQGRARIELRVEHVDHVAVALEAHRPVVVRDSAQVVDDVLAALDTATSRMREPAVAQVAGAGRP